MELHFNVTKEARKAMVKAIETELGVKAKYLGAPGFAYQIGDYKVEKDGTLSWADVAEADATQIDQSSRVIDACVMATGNSPKEWESNEEEATKLNIEMPRDFYTDESLKNLRKLVDSKANLIKKAFGASELPIEISDTKVSFPWFKTSKAEEAKAYGDFISKISIMANEAKRVTAREKDVESEKYSFRCFLLRLGFKGKEYKEDRKILLRNLDGSAAFPTKEAADEFAKKQKEKKEEMA